MPLGKIPRCRRTADPLRLVALTDKEPSRSVHSVNRLGVLDLRAPQNVAGK